jgi:hypothetical protein
MKDDDWRIRRYYSGVFREISYEEFRRSLKEQELQIADKNRQICNLG